MKHGKYVASASSSGNITFWDPSSYKKEHCTKFHTGGVSSFDVAGNYLVTTGYSLRYLLFSVVFAFIMLDHPSLIKWALFV